MTQKRKILGIGLLMLCMTGCGGKTDAYLQTMQQVTEQESNLSSENVQHEEHRTDTEDTETACYVYVCGNVKNPGVYCLGAGSRIYEAVALAGGLTEEAADTVNQAETVFDGMMIRIPSVREEEQTKKEEQTKEEAARGDGKLNLNTADVTQLMTLPGIGETKAKSIIAYREAKGGFTSVEEIMKVDGIKEGVYNRLKDSVTVR